MMNMIFSVDGHVRKFLWTTLIVYFLVSFFNWDGLWFLDIPRYISIDRVLLFVFFGVVLFIFYILEYFSKLDE